MQSSRKIWFIIKKKKTAAKEAYQKVSQILELANNKFIFHKNEENENYRTGEKRKRKEMYWKSLKVDRGLQNKS